MDETIVLTLLGAIAGWFAFLVISLVLGEIFFKDDDQ